MPLLDPQHDKSIEGLLNGCFPVPQGASFYDDFPVWEPTHGAKAFRFGVLEGDHLISTAFLRAARLRTLGGSSLRVGLIGGVTTDAGHRGKGLASEIVGEAIEKARALKLQTLLLWGSEHTLYGRLGFQLSGTQWRAGLSACLKESHHPRATQGEMKSGFSSELFSLLQARKEGLILEQHDEQWMSRHRNVSWLTWAEAGKIKAYVAAHRGIDLQGYVHEWGGETPALMALLGELAKKEPDLLILGPSDTPKRLALSKLPLDTVTEPLALFLNLDPQAPTGTEFEKIWIWGLDAS